MFTERPRRLYVVSTSDRVTFKRCHRRWDLQSKNRRSLVPVGAVPAKQLWLGSGFHFALEDYHGYRYFDKPADAFRAYAGAHRPSELPDEHVNQTELACGMLDYYADHWFPQRQDIGETLWIDDVPQVEVNIQVPLDIKSPSGYDEVVYSITLDRLIVDDHGRIVVEDYKTAQRMYEPGRLELDPQLSSYLWGAGLLYGDRVEGACWLQFLKAVPHQPEVLSNGELSQNKNQYTTYSIYKAALMEYYAEVPEKYIPFLNHLASMETPESDRFIRREVIYRNETFKVNEERKIFEEIRDMTDPDLKLYPNPTRDCTWDCQYKDVCIAMDDGSDWEFMIESGFEKWEGEGYKSTAWRSRLKYPDAIEVELGAA